MSLNDSLQDISNRQEIANRLYKENICHTPLDNRSLEIIEQYQNYYIPFSDLCRRLSDIELNYVQIASEADDALIELDNIRKDVIEIGNNLTKHWRENGYLHGFIISSDETVNADVCSSYLLKLEKLRYNLNQFSSILLILSETSAQIRACSASFGEVHKESKLAIYAAMLNRDVESVLDCRATSLQALASAKECERLSGKLMGNARLCTRIINCINCMIIDVNRSLSIDTFEYSVATKVSPIKASNSICDAITILENLNIEK